MFISGYHGTTLDAAENILKENKYNLSTKDTEWLGDGIYFYFDINEAYTWNDAEAITHSVIKIETDEYLDIDSEIGREIVSDTKKMIFKDYGYTINESGPKKVQKNQRKVMQMIWDHNPDIKVLAASFPTEPNDFVTLTDPRRMRREFCVRSNDYIKHTHIIKRRDLDD